MTNKLQALNPTRASNTRSPLISVEEMENTLKQIERLEEIAKLLRYAEERYYNHLRNATGIFGSYKDIHKASITLAAYKRIRQSFNNVANEIQL